MPLFGSKHRKETAPASQPAPAHRTSADHNNRAGFYGGPQPASTSARNSSGSPPASTVGHSPSTGKRNMLHKDGGAGSHGSEDQSIAAARQRVLDAERLEKDADEVLKAAQQKVREAKEESERLRREAAEEAKRARQKEAEAEDIASRAKPLGRHGS